MAKSIFLVVDGMNANSKLSEIVSFTIMAAIILSFIVSILESMKQYQYLPHQCPNPACNNDPVLCPGIMMCEPISIHTLNVLESICIIVFTTEFGIRLTTVWAVNSREADIIPNSWGIGVADPMYPMHEHYFRFLTNWKNLVDVATIVPYWFLLAFNNHSQGSGFLRVLRCLRVFKLLRRFESLQTMLDLVFKTFERTLPALSVMIVLLIIGMVFFGSIVYVVEGGVYTVNADFPHGEYIRHSYNQVTWEISPFQSIPSAMYWFMVTACTVGYGDLVPTSWLGRAIGGVVMVIGLLVLGLPIAAIGSSFTDAYKIEVTSMFARAGVGLRVQTLDEQGISELFDEIDNDSNELITEEELFEVIKSRGVRIDRFWFKAMIVAEDPNGDNMFTREEFISICMKMKAHLNMSYNYRAEQKKHGILNLPDDMEHQNNYSIGNREDVALMMAVDSNANSRDKNKPRMSTSEVVQALRTNTAHSPRTASAGSGSSSPVDSTSARPVRRPSLTKTSRVTPTCDADIDPQIKPTALATHPSVIATPTATTAAAAGPGAAATAGAGAGAANRLESVADGKQSEEDEEEISLDWPSDAPLGHDLAAAEASSNRGVQRGSDELCELYPPGGAGTALAGVNEMTTRSCTEFDRQPKGSGSVTFQVSREGEKGVQIDESKHRVGFLMQLLVRMQEENRVGLDEVAQIDRLHRQECERIQQQRNHDVAQVMQRVEENSRQMAMILAQLQNINLSDDPE